MTAGNQQAPNGLAASPPAIEWEDSQGQRRSALLSRAGLTVGSAPGNAIVLSDDAIARYHVRLDWDGSQVLATTLSPRGATIGTTTLPQPPAPGVGWDGSSPLMVGPYRLRLSRAVPITQPAPTLAPAANLEIRLDGNTEFLELTPGKPETIRARIINRGTARDSVQVSVDGLRPEWVSVNPATVQLNPSLPAVVAITVDVPRSSNSRAGSFPVTIRAKSERGAVERALRWQIASYAEHILDLRPARAEVANDQPANYSVAVRNTGNATMSYDLHAGYDDPSLEYDLDPSTIVVEPGKEGRVALRVRARERLSSREQLHRFSVESVPASGTTQVSSAAYARRRQLPLWVWPMALVTLLLLLGLTATAVASMRREPTPTVVAAVTPPTNTATPETPTTTLSPLPSQTPVDVAQIAEATQTAAALINQVSAALESGTAAVDAALEAAQNAGSTAAAEAAAIVGQQAQQAAEAREAQAAQAASNATSVSAQAQEAVAGTTGAIAARTEQAAPVAALQTTVAVLQYTPTHTATPTSIPTNTPTHTATSEPTATEPPTATPFADLRVQMRGSSNPVAAGGVLSYTIRVDNFGPATATGIQVTNQLDDDVEFSQEDVPEGQNCRAGAGVVICDIASMALRATEFITLPVRVRASSGTISNNVRVDAATADPVPGNNEDNETTTVAIATDLELLLSASAEQVGAGQPLTYTLSLTNDGSNPAPLPSIFTEVSEGEFRSGLASPEWRCRPAGRRITCDSNSTLAPGRTITATLALRAPEEPQASGVITATSTASSNILDQNPENNVDRVSTRVVPAADLRIKFIADEILNPLYAGEPFTYVLRVSNAGPSPATNIQVITQLPGLAQYLPDPPPENWNCTLPAPRLTCTLQAAQLDAGDEIDLEIRVNAPSSAGPIDAAAVVKADTLDPASSGEENLATIQLEIVGKANLAILSFTPDELKVATNAMTSFILTIRNEGPSAAQSIVATITPSEGLRFTGTISPGWTCTPPESPVAPIGALECKLDELASGTTSTLRLSFVAPATSGKPSEEPPRVTVDANISSTTYERDDTKGDNNNDDASIIVYQPPAIPLDQLADPEPIFVNNTVTFTITPSGTQLRYRWYSSVDRVNFAFITETKQPSYTTLPLTFVGIYYFRVEAINDIGVVTSRDATVTVNAQSR